MSQSTRLFARGQQYAAAQFPAQVIIAGQEYDCATSGLQLRRTLGLGGWVRKKKVSFWIPTAAFTVAGKPLPVERSPLTWNGILFTIESLLFDAGAVNVTLRCQSPDE